jgi:uncharacterized protein YfcZ (UPF0381/DUF406 family)
MAVKINQTGVRNAVALIREGKVDTKSSWEMTTEDENAILGDGNWKEYAKWFLALDDEANEETKAHYKFPFGKNGKLYRSALIAIRQRAGQFGYQDVFDEAGKLLAKVDESNFESVKSKWFTIFWNGRHNNSGAKKEWTPEDVERIYEANKDREIPLTIRHPEDDLPIIGFAKGLRKKIQDGKVVLEAQLKKISKAILERLKELNFDKVSIALEPDLATIRHIGFVENPAIEGLPPVQFENSVEIDVSQLLEEFKMQEEFEKVSKEKAELEKELEALKEELRKTKRENARIRFEAETKELTRELPPAIKEKATKVLEVVFERSTDYEFEKDTLYEAIVELIKVIPKPDLRPNVAGGSNTDFENKLTEIEKKVNMFNKKLRG